MKKLSVFSLIVSLLFVFSCEDKKDTTPPEVTITSPSNDSKVNEVVTVTCMSTDNKEVTKVELWVDGQSTGLIDETEPYSFKWNTTEYKDGDHTLIVRGYDSSDNEGDSPPVKVNVDNTVSVPVGVSVKSVSFSNGGFTIDWSKSTDGDFKSYSVEHSVESEMNDYEEIFTTEDVNVTTTRMEDTSPLSYHYFRVTVTDTFDYQTKGSIYSSSLDPVPDSVDVKSVTYDLEKMTVEWDKSNVGDFGSYKLLYSKTESGDRDTLKTYTNNNTTSYSTSTYDPTIENWYWVIVSDTLDQSKIGNGKTNNINSPPTPIDITSVTYDLEKMKVTWDESKDWDFKKYTLYKGVDQFDTNNSIVSDFEENSTLEYTVNTFDPTKENWFFIKVTNHFGQESEVGEKKRNDIDKDPNSSIVGITKSDENYNIVWSSNLENDFYSYKLYESEYSDMTNKVLLKETMNSNDTTFVKSGIQLDNKFYYHVETTDVWGLNSYSGPEFISTLLKVLYESKKKLNIMDIEGSYILQFGNQNEIQNFSPDGKTIVYGHYGNQIHSINVDGTDNKQLITSGSTNYDIKYNYDGTKILFTTYISPNHYLYQMDVDGGNQTILSNEDIRVFSVSKNTNRVTYTYSTDEQNVYSYDISLDEEIGIVIGGTNIHPKISNDGSKIVYVLQEPNRGEIYLIDFDGYNKVDLWDINEDQYYPILTKDNKKIIYVNNPNIGNQLKIMDVDGKNKTVLVQMDNNIDRIINPKISYDGKKVLFHTKGSQGFSKIFIVDIDGNNFKELRRNLQGEIEPQFEPR